MKPRFHGINQHINGIIDMWVMKKKIDFHRERIRRELREDREIKIGNK